MNIQQFYVAQSKITDPGNYGHLFDDLPNDLPELCKIIQNLVMHYADEDVFGYQIPASRYREMDDRCVEKILDRIMYYDQRPLKVTREVDKRVIGVCRDISVLLCSVLRHRKIPARLRSGFVSYCMPGFNPDGVCVEYWNDKCNKWCVIDSRTTLALIKKYKMQIDFDLYDVPIDKFLPAENVWKLCRSKIMRPNHFGSRQHRGLWYVRNRLIHEIAFINKEEVLVWDMWGHMLSEKNRKPFIPAEQYIILDRLASIIQEKRNELTTMQQCYQQDGYSVPDTVVVFNPFLKRRVEYVNVK